jgi:transposase
VAHLHKKIKKGRPYYYIREITRIDGKPKVTSQIYLGSLERLAELAQGEKSSGCTKIIAQEFGALWLANLIDNGVGLVSLIDSVVPRRPKEEGPSVGEYFLYAVLNRMVDSCSKRALPDWYKQTAIQQIRPVDIDALDSQRYWEKWDQVEEKHIKTIANLFFERIIKLERPDSDCFLFDTTNYYTYMASQTESELAQRGKNKEGKSWLRQVGVALLVSRGNQIPLFYREYEGNRHDSKVFAQVLEQVLAAMKSTTGRKGELTIAFDKGMNSEDNIAAIDAVPQAHFITTYSPHNAEDLIRTKLSLFKPVDTVKNRELASKGQEDDQLVAWPTTGTYWGKGRTVVVTYNPRTAAKQRYAFEKKLLALQGVLLDLREKVKTQKSHWTSDKRVESHYADACQRLYLPKDLYEISVEKYKKKWRLLFRKNHYRIGKHIELFGKNIIITDHLDWSTDEIVRASLDRYMVENAFRQSKNDDLVSVMPMRHWTDSKIRCHILTCVVALAYLRLIEIRLERSGVPMTAATAMTHMNRLHSCLWWGPSARKPQRLLEEPTPVQAEILAAFGYEIASGVLQSRAL